jgi:4-hydroxybenzoate polyprenyltransferase
MKEFLELVRWRNLLIIIITMVLMRYAVIAPLLSKIMITPVNNPATKEIMQLQFPLPAFFLLVLATVLIAAGGYVINDYFDIRADLINRGKVIVGTRIERRTAMLWHLVLNVVGVLIGFFISWLSGFLMMGALFLIVSGLLYFYSASYKKQFLVGNIIVALLTAAVPMIVALYEWPALYRYYAVNAVKSPEMGFILYWIGGFALFAFLTTLAREIIKDIEDFAGDREYGRNTVPVVLGIVPAKIVSLAINAVTVALLYLAWFRYVRDNITLIYISVGVVIPIVISTFVLMKENGREKLHLSGNMMKVAMFFGVLYSVVVSIILKWNLF